MPIGVVYMLHMCTDKQFSTLQTHSTRIKESIGLQKLYSYIFLHVQCASFPTLFLSHSIICPSICLSLIASGLWWYIKLYLPYWKNLHAVLKYILFMVPGGDFLYYIWHWVSFHILVSPSSGTCAVGCTMLYSSLELVLFSVNNMTFRKSPVITVLLMTVQLPGQPLPLSSWKPGFFLPTTQLQPVFFKGILVPLLPSAPHSQLTCVTSLSGASLWTALRHTVCGFLC